MDHDDSAAIAANELATENAALRSRLAETEKRAYDLLVALKTVIGSNGLGGDVPPEYGDENSWCVTAGAIRQAVAAIARHDSDTRSQ